MSLTGQDETPYCLLSDGEVKMFYFSISNADNNESFLF